MTLAGLGHHDEALAAWGARLQSQPDDAPAWLQQARSLQCLGRHEKALPSCRRAMALDPALGAGWSLLGQALKDHGQLDEAADVSFELRPSLGYAHGQPYRRALARRHGLPWLAQRLAPLREDQGRAVAGLHVVLGTPWRIRRHATSPSAAQMHRPRAVDSAG